MYILIPSIFKSDHSEYLFTPLLLQGMNSAVRAVVRMGLYVGAKVFFIKEGYQVREKGRYE